ncbi:MAG TPA: thioesterase family protein [Polyangiaceae bacterium]|nr:thioesterase family protein [Polyangiaceae bacterium]
MTTAPGFRFSHRLRVRWAEVDPQGVVFNGNYLTYFDVGITEYWRALGLAYPDGFLKHGVDTFAVKATIEFSSPARYDDEIDVSVRCSKLGRTSFTTMLAVRRGDELLVTGEMIYVCVDPKARKPVPVPDAIREKIRDYERSAPAETPPS